MQAKKPAPRAWQFAVGTILLLVIVGFYAIILPPPRIVHSLAADRFIRPQPDSPAPAAASVVSDAPIVAPAQPTNPDEFANGPQAPAGSGHGGCPEPEDRDGLWPVECSPSCRFDVDGNLEDDSCILQDWQHAAVARTMALEHMEVFSTMSKDGQRFLLDFGDHSSYNPNLIPHPYKTDTWIMVARRDQSKDDSTLYSGELVCEAQFVDNAMRCTKSPLLLPIGSTISPHCTDNLEFLNDIMGPHDARVFYGPDQPYAVYGAPTKNSCLGQWIHDLRRLVDWGYEAVDKETRRFFWPTPLQRPGSYNRIEKNWMVFWDRSGDMYIHYDVHPTRVFAKLEEDGSVGDDLAPATAGRDQQCLAALMPKIEPNTHLESIHQATNSLAVTMCKRSDPDCEETADNTFVFFIFQKKGFFMHGMYDPYVMMFQQTPPFEVHGISEKPFWISGRGEANGTWVQNTAKPKDQSQFLFATAMSWKQQGLRYHGFLDDTLFLTFGIEDQESGAIDVVAGDLLSNIALCSNVG